MPADNTAQLIDSAHRRHELTRAKAIRALRELDRAGIPVTFELAARTAEVSRSWLYSQPDIRDQIQQRIKARGHLPTELAALKCLYLVARSLDPTGTGQA